MHDDQHGTAVVLLARCLNALKVMGKELASIKVVVNGLGAAGTAVLSHFACRRRSPADWLRSQWRRA